MVRVKVVDALCVFSEERGKNPLFFYVLQHILQFFFLKICIYQKFVVPLHSKSERDLITNFGR